MDHWCAPGRFSGSSRKYAGRVVLVVLPTCAKIAPVEDLHTLAVSHVSKAMGTPPLTVTAEGRWTVLGSTTTDSTTATSSSGSSGVTVWEGANLVDIPKGGREEGR